jgi:hypothetical protein
VVTYEVTVLSLFNKAKLYFLIVMVMLLPAPFHVAIFKTVTGPITDKRTRGTYIAVVYNAENILIASEKIVEQ